jgi:hypothetical protein
MVSSSIGMKTYGRYVTHRRGGDNPGAGNGIYSR